MVKSSSEFEGGSHGEEIVSGCIDTSDLNIVFSGWSDGWDIEWEGLGPDGSWVDGGGGWVEFLVVDLGAKEPASELKLLNGEWVGSKSGDSELLGGSESGRVWGSLGLVHEDLEVLLTGVLDEGHWGGDGWEVTVGSDLSVWGEFVGGNGSCESECLEHCI